MIINNFNPKSHIITKRPYDKDRSLIHNLCIKHNVSEVLKAKCFKRILKGTRLLEDKSVNLYCVVEGTIGYGVISLVTDLKGNKDFQISLFDDSDISDKDIFEDILKGTDWTKYVSGGNSNYTKDSYEAFENLIYLVSGKDMIKELLW